MGKAPVKTQVGMTVRLDGDLSRKFGAILSLQGLSAQEYIRGIIVEYVEKNLHLINIEALEEWDKKAGK
jgi:hypothetical protein